jgi:hypothetical protein
LEIQCYWNPVREAMMEPPIQAVCLPQGSATTLTSVFDMGQGGNLFLRSVFYAWVQGLATSQEYVGV